MEIEIDGLIDDGWKPRIKKRKKLRYITLRKGNQEKSLGPYTEELWEKVKPVDPWATPAQITELEKRIGKIEKTKRRENISFDAELLKRIKKLEEDQGAINTTIYDLLSKFQNMILETYTSALQRVKGNNACKYIDTNGFCHNWHYPYDEVEKREYLRAVGRTEYMGKPVFLVNVKEHPLICSACPSYRRRSESSRNPVNKASIMNPAPTII